MNEFNRGDMVVFQPNDKEHPLKGRVSSNPYGRHRVYKVTTFQGERFQVPEVLLERLSN